MDGFKENLLSIMRSNLKCYSQKHFSHEKLRNLITLNGGIIPKEAEEEFSSEFEVDIENRKTLIYPSEFKPSAEMIAKVNSQPMPTMTYDKNRDVYFTLNNNEKNIDIPAQNSDTDSEEEKELIFLEEFIVSDDMAAAIEKEWKDHPQVALYDKESDSYYTRDINSISISNNLTLNQDETPCENQPKKSSSKSQLIPGIFAPKHDSKNLLEPEQNTDTSRLSK